MISAFSINPTQVDTPGGGSIDVAVGATLWGIGGFAYDTPSAGTAGTEVEVFIRCE